MAKRKVRLKSSKKKWLWLTLIVVLVLAGAGAGYGYSVWHNVKSTVDNELHKPVGGIDTDVTKQKVEDKDPINLLLLGIDERDGDKGRSDSMIVMTLDPAGEQMQMVSIPRDTRTDIVGQGVVDKINHAYAFGGSEMSVDTVEDFLDIELDYYVRMNMEGLAQLVDALGGITVTNDHAFTQNGHSFDTGEQDLDGERSLAYVRNRKDDPEGDLGRNERQRDVVGGIIEKGAHFNVVSKIGDIMDVLGENMVTNMTFADMRQLATDYRSARASVTDYQMAGDDARINDIYYQIMPDEEVTKVHDMIEEFGE